jgi:hypothetical protein
LKKVELKLVATTLYIFNVLLMCCPNVVVEAISIIEESMKLGDLFEKLFYWIFIFFRFAFQMNYHLFYYVGRHHDGLPKSMKWGNGREEWNNLLSLFKQLIMDCIVYTFKYHILVWWHVVKLGPICCFDWVHFEITYLKLMMKLGPN